MNENPSGEGQAYYAGSGRNPADALALGTAA
jgi:hypothetical protein